MDLTGTEPSNAIIVRTLVGHAATMTRDLPILRASLKGLIETGLHGRWANAHRQAMEAGIAALEGRQGPAEANHREALSALRGVGALRDVALVAMDRAAVSDNPAVVAEATQEARYIWSSLGADAALTRLEKLISRRGAVSSSTGPRQGPKAHLSRPDPRQRAVVAPDGGYARLVALDHLIEASDRNLVAAFEVLARHSTSCAAVGPRRFGHVIAIPTGLRAPYFNPVIQLSPGDPSWVHDAVVWMRGLGVPASLRIREDAIDEPLLATTRRLGLEREAWTEPGMALSPIRDPPANPRDLSVTAALSATLESWYRASAAGIGVPADALEVVRTFMPATAVDDPDERLFGGYLDGEPVASSIAIRSGDVVGVYAVGTADSARRRGIGTAMTWACLRAGREWGCRTAVLQSSAMGVGMYRAIGFRQVTRYVSFSPASVQAHR
jgi:GNAT superfamily N-acetyltransferase